VDGRPVVFFHVHGLKRVTLRIYDMHLDAYGLRGNARIRTWIYQPYVRALSEAAAQAAVVHPSSGPEDHLRAGPPVSGLLAAVRRAWTMLRAAWSGNLLRQAA
jgi:hypothetical protein